MVTLKSAYKNAVYTLERASIESADFEAACLIEKLTNTKFHSTAYEDICNKTISEMAFAQLEMYIARRLRGEPLQYILGEWEFYGMPFKVGRGVLIPRQDTETLVEIVMKKAGNKKKPVLIDLCSGSGCVAIALEKQMKLGNVWAVELSPEAVGFFEANKELNSSKAKLVVGDCLDKAVIDALPMADVITCNPPYLTKSDMESLQTEVGYEPETALYGGDDGLDFYRDIIRLWKKKLNNKGVIAFEVGMGQDKEVSQILIQHGFTDVRRVPDLCGINRVVLGYLVEDYESVKMY